MSDQRLVIANCLAFTTKEVRDKVHGYLHDIVDFAKANEPDTLKYAICIPDDPSDESTLYVFEEFTDQASFDKHMSSKPVTDLTSLETDQSLLRPEFSHRRLAYIPGAFFSRPSRLPNAAPSADQVEHPYIIWATITDPHPADIDALEPYGAAVVKYAQENEPDTISYADLKLIDSASNQPSANFIAALEIYASKEACLKHLRDPPVQALKAEGAKLESTFKLVFLNMVEGFLAR